jgi:phosphate transport system permease protein
VSSTVFVDKNTKAVIFLFASFSIAVTLMIFGMLLYETIKFFSDVSPVDFFFRVKWYPQSYDYDPHNSFGVVSVFSGTFLISFIAVLIAVPFGIGSAVFISEYIKSDTLKPLVKSVIEVLAGIPTIVYGYFAVYTFSRFLVFLSNITGFDISPESALNAGVVIGIMITPYITSLVYEALNSVPSFLRYSAFAMACTKGEVITKVLIPYSIPQIINASSLAFSRAIGETMIVLMSAGMFANMTLNPFESVTTATVQIVQLLTGDQEFSNPKTMSSFALGFSLFIITLFLNFIALYISKRYEKHHF